MKKKHNTITKTEFLEELAASLSITKSDSEKFYEVFHKMIYRYLKDGYAVQLSGFGTYSVSHRNPREGVNPQTMERMMIKELNTPKFSAGEGFKNAIKLRK